MTEGIRDNFLSFVQARDEDLGRWIEDLFGDIPNDLGTFPSLAMYPILNNSQIQTH